MPDPGFLYPSNHHRQAVAHLKYGLDREGGFILLTGEVGTGKTTLTRTMLKRMPPHIRVAYVLNSKLNVTDVLASICDELGLELPTETSEFRGLSFAKVCIDALNQDLLKTHAEGKKTLIVIEEAQNLSADVLEALRLLSNLETNTHKLLHILLVGQPELLDILAQKELRQLNQRVVSRFHLLPLDKDDVANYVNHRLHRAGARGSLFDSACISVLFRLTGGVPRLINLVCQHSLLATYSTGAKTVSPRLVKDAAAEILGPQNTHGWSKKPFIIVGLILILCATLIITLAKQTGELPEPSAGQEPSAGKEPSADQEPSVDAQPSSAANAPGVIDTSPIIDTSAGIASPAIAKMPATQASQTSPFTGLLNLWSVDTPQIYSEEEFTAQANYNRLRTVKMSNAIPADLQSINRPGVVWIKQSLDNNQSSLKSALLTGLDQTNAYLQIAGQSAVIPRAQFLNSWSGAYLYLWQPHPSINALKVGDNNSQAVSWLQDQLAIINQSSERIITGGRYTDAIVQKVIRFQVEQDIKADGVVGRETIMRLNQLANRQFPRLVREDF